MKKNWFLSTARTGLVFFFAAFMALLTPPAAHADQCATFDSGTMTLHVPCLTLGHSYWLDLGFVGTDSITFNVKQFGVNAAAPNVSQCATFDPLRNTLRLTCLDLEGTRFWLDLALLFGSSILLDANQFDQRRTSSGLYSYDEGLAVLSLNTQTSNLAECGGPPIGLIQLPVVSVTSTAITLIVDEDGDQLVFSRIGGQGPGLIGSWWTAEEGDQIEAVFNEDGTFSLSGNASECATFLAKRKTIAVDCNFNDWNDRDRVYLDTDGPDCGNVAGRDMKEVYFAQDSNFIYGRFVLNGPLDPSFGYKFGNDNMHIIVRTLNGRSDIQYFRPGQGNGTFSSSSVCVSGNQFEFRLGKSDVRPFWVGQRLEAWCDQGTTTVCRDSADLPFLDLGL